MSDMIMLEVAVVVYALMSLRWFFIIRKKHREMLVGAENENTTHVVFRSMIFMYAVGLSVVAPLISFVWPQCLNNFTKTHFAIPEKSAGVAK